MPTPRTSASRSLATCPNTGTRTFRTMPPPSMPPHCCHAACSASSACWQGGRRHPQDTHATRSESDMGTAKRLHCRAQAGKKHTLLAQFWRRVATVWQRGDGALVKKHIGTTLTSRTAAKGSVR
jgi:hypothetical protein